MKNLHKILSLILALSTSCEVAPVAHNVRPTWETLGSHNSVAVHYNEPYYITVEFVVFAEHEAMYPVTVQAFKDAATQWANCLPVHVRCYTEDPNLFIPMFGPMVFHDRDSIIKVYVTDMGSPELGHMSPNIIGLWDSPNKKLFLHGEHLENNYNLAYSTALHELGHAFGIPHIVGAETPIRPFTGWIVLPPGSKDRAESMVMFPARVAGETQDALSPLEISIAEHYIRHGMTNINRVGLCEYEEF